MQFALAPREPATSLQTVFLDYMQLETLLRAQTGALEHARLPRQPRPAPAPVPVVARALVAAPQQAPAAQAPAPDPSPELTSAASLAAGGSAELRGHPAGDRGEAAAPAAAASPQPVARPGASSADDAEALRLQLAAAQAAAGLVQATAGAAAQSPADASQSRSQPGSPPETKPTHLLLNPRAPGTPAAAPATGAASSPQISPQPGAVPGGAPQPPLDVFIDDPSLLQRVAEYVPKVVAKELPNPGESSDAGTSEVWRQLKQRDAQGRLTGISPHQGSTTSACAR